jgi:hypothetical protein
MPKEDYLTRQQSILTNWLNKWAGGNVRLWSYTVSHKVLVLRLTHPDKLGHLHVNCGDVSKVCCLSEWDDADFSVEARNISAEDHEFTLIDRKRDCRVVCGVIEAKENVKT